MFIILACLQCLTTVEYYTRSCMCLFNSTSTRSLTNILCRCSNLLKHINITSLYQGMPAIEASDEVELVSPLCSPATYSLVSIETLVKNMYPILHKVHLRLFPGNRLVMECQINTFLPCLCVIIYHTNIN